MVLLILTWECRRCSPTCWPSEDGLHLTDTPAGRTLDRGEITTVKCQLQLTGGVVQDPADRLRAGLGGHAHLQGSPAEDPEEKIQSVGFSSFRGLLTKPPLTLILKQFHVTQFAV